MEKVQFYEELLGIPSVKVVDVVVEPKVLQIICESKIPSQNCPNCGANTKTINQYYHREVRDLNMGIRHVFLRIKIRQFCCGNCSRFFSETLDFVDLGNTFTDRQKDYMFCLARKQSYTEVAAIVNTSPKTVERIVLATAAKIADVPQRYKLVRRLGIDEQSHKKGKKDFFCILTDLDRGIIVDILPNRKKTTLVTHFKALGTEFCSQITDVSCDYWDAYIETSKVCFPQANIILDRFHVTKLLNIPLDSFRKSLRKNNPNNSNYKQLKWILYKQYHTLSDKQLDILDAAFLDSPLLKAMYFHREQFHHILDNSSSVDEAIVSINSWVEKVQNLGTELFNSFIKTLISIKKYVANYVKNYLSNAVTEGLNNLIRSIRRTAFGMSNFDHLRLRVLAIST